MEQKENTEDPHPQNQERRIVLLGKTGSGKSHLANIIFWEDLFHCDPLPVSGTIKCQRETRCVGGRSITLIDTPGFFDTDKSEEEMKPEIVSCITECAPGPHAFLILLKVERFTEQEQEVIDKILQYFSEDALKYAVIVFTHGEDLPDGMKIEQFVRHNKSLNDLVQKCGGRCHVVDNKHWNNKGESDYRSNQVQVKELLNTIDKLVKDNNGGHYTIEMLKLVEQQIKKEEEKIRQLSRRDETEEEIRNEAETRVSNRFPFRLADDQALLETPVVGNVALKVRADQERLHTSANRDSTAPAKVFKTMEQKENTEDPHQQNQERRIILLGKAGSGKSHLANIIFREDLFQYGSLSIPGTSKCQTETRCVGGRSITLIDTPGFIDTGESEEKMNPEIVKCITECAPGPHAFLIVLRAERFTKHEREVIDKILQYFSKDALKYAVIVFTHGEDLPDGMKIEEFVRHNKSLNDLVQKCGGRCHVVDNKYWNNKGGSDYRSNQVQVKELLNTIDKLVKDNNGGHYTNEMLELAEQQIQKEEEKIRQLSRGDKTKEEIRKEAKTRVSNRFLIQLAGTATGVLLGAFSGVRKMVRNVITALRNLF